MLTLTRPQACQTIGVISDVHSNYIALEAVLAEMERRRIEALLFLGDYITDGPSPQRTLSLLREAAEREVSAEELLAEIIKKYIERNERNGG